MAAHALVVTGGHPFDESAFLDVFEALAGTLDGTTFEHVEQPAALQRVVPGRVGADAVVFYDMPGLRFRRGDPPVELVEPPPGYVAGLRRLLADGVGLVFLHHSIASWPSSPEFAELVGGRFHYRPGTLGGIDYPDSGYAFDITHTVEVVDRQHPICVGLPPRFEITDELYQFPVLTHLVHPLMRTTHPTQGPMFASADAALRSRRAASVGTRHQRTQEDRTGWRHPPGSDLLAWTRRFVGDERLAYLQFGDGPITYVNDLFRMVLGNAVAWAART